MIGLVTIITTLVSCKQLKEMANFSKCEFRLRTVENIMLAGVNVQSIKTFSDVTVMDAAKLMAAIGTNSLPLQFTLNMDVKNPNPTPASMSKLDWILFIDDIQMVQGTTQNRIQIPQNGGISNYPLIFNINLKDVIKDKTGQSLINFGLNLAGAGNQPTRFTLKAKPYVYIGNLQIPYPSYIDVKTNFTSK